MTGQFVKELAAGLVAVALFFLIPALMSAAKLAGWW